MRSVLTGVTALPTLVRRARAKRLVLFGNVLDAHHVASPSAAAAVSLFEREWASRLPPPYSELDAGAVPLFEDERITWAVDALGGVEGLSVLELGPLEAGHTFMLERAGAASIVAVESNGRAYLRCLVVKELLGLRARFALGDALAYLRSSDERFDLCVANGILYHMPDPVALVEAISQRARRLMLWTHYYDADVARSNVRMRRKMRSSRPALHDGFRHTLHEHHYGLALRSAGFCGGTQRTANWLSREDLFACLVHYGWRDIQTAFEQRDHPNGPSLALVAQRA